jgi:asparagine synthase (glutamine-hydrolysing)
MCGIAGQARSDGRPVDRGMLERMCAAQEHRGPDSRGTHLEDEVGLGIQRLRVIDLDTGDQPIYNEDRSVAVVLNGEIYNYRELRERLQGRGHRLATKGDTEVIAHLYEDLGVDCVRELNGMFAFALWDAKRRRLLVARDRVGKKPLFYAIREGAISFASELRALLQDPEVPREIDHAAIDGYVAYGYVPAPMSAFRAVRKLPPASTLVYEDGRASIARYWRLRYDQGDPPAGTAELHEEIRTRIRAAVARRMISDVPLGVFLSGGIDSSAVVAAMAEQSSDPVRTFSIGFEEESFNELPNARLIAERFGTDHRELVIRPDVVSILPKVARHYGEPFADSSSVPSFYVAEMARREVTVALNGDGGDESFAGYNRYVTATRAHRIASRLPGALRRGIAAAGARSPVRGDPARPANRARRLAGYLGMSDRELYSDAMQIFDGRRREDLYSPGFAESLGGSAPELIEGVWEKASGRDLVNKMLEVDVNTYLPDDLLVKVDVASMAYSLEARSPLLDHELMEFAASIPGGMKLQGSEKKVVLRNALRGWIPDQILDGPKRGFALPMVGQWFRGELRDYMAEVLTDPSTLARGYFNEPYVRGLIDRHLDGSEDNHMQLWSLIMLEVWHRELVDQAP